jgi:5-formyltetrahydrofolate cyclo-ligase
MMDNPVASWRAETRRRLLAARLALDAATIEHWRVAIDRLLERAFPELALGMLAIYWPIRNEYDARPLATRLRSGGLRACMPALVEPDAPMHYREWHEGVETVRDALGIATPVGTAEAIPRTLLVPLVGWDECGYRLGYGGGYFDRTLAALDPSTLAIGVGYEQGRLSTIHPQPWDLPMSYIVTEHAAYRRVNDRLETLFESSRGAD